MTDKITITKKQFIEAFDSNWEGDGDDCWAAMVKKCKTPEDHYVEWRVEIESDGVNREITALDGFVAGFDIGIRTKQ